MWFAFASRSAHNRGGFHLSSLEPSIVSGGSFSPRPVPEAVPLGGAPRRGGYGGKILVFLAFFVLLGLFTAGMVGLAMVLAAKKGTAAGPDNFVEYWETAAERLANISAAMASREPGCSTAELRDLQRFFARLENGIRSGDDEAWRKCVDLNLLVQRIAAHPAVRDDGSFNRSWIKSRLEYELTSPELAGSLSILRVERGNRDDQLLVYTLDEGYGELYTFRWWLARSGRQWRLFDYDRIDYGQSLAAGWALSEAIVDDPYQYNYTRLYEAIDSATETHLAGPQYLRGTARYVSAGTDSSLTTVVDLPQPTLAYQLTRLDLAWRFHWHGQPSEALRMCEQVKSPAECAGILLVRAQAERAMGRSAPALAAAEAYAALVGETPDALAELGYALEACQRRQEAAEKWLRLAEKSPDSERALDQFTRLAGREQLPALREVLLRARDPLETASRLGESALMFNRYAAHEWLAQFVHDEAPGSALDLSLEGAFLEAVEEYVPAAERFLAASKLEWLPAKQEEYVDRHLRAMIELGRGDRAMRDAADPKGAFDRLLSEVEEDLEYEWDSVHLDQLGPVLAAYREREPADARGDYYAGILLLRAQRWSEAEACFQRAAGKGSDEWLTTQITDRRIEASYRRGKMLPVYRELGRTPEVFRALAGLCSGDKAWSDLQTLIAEHRLHQPEDPWIDYYLAQEAAGREAYGEAAAALARAARAGGEEFDFPWMRNRYLVEAGQMREALRLGDDREATFQQIASLIESDGKWQKLLELAELPEASGLADQPKRRLQALFELGRYYDFLEAAPSHVEAALRGDSGLDVQLVTNAVRAHLRVGQLEEARELALRIEKELADPVPLVMVLIAERDFAALGEKLQEKALVDRLLSDRLHLDPELAPLLMSLELADIRRGWMLPAPFEPRAGRLVLWLRDSVPDPSEAALAADLSQVAGTEVHVVPIPAAAGSTRQSFRLETSHGTLVVTFGTAALEDCRPIESPALTALIAACDEAGSWVAIDFPPVAPGLREEILETWACRLVREWATSRTWGETPIVAVGGDRKNKSKLTHVSDETLEQLRRGEFLTKGPWLPLEIVHFDWVDFQSQRAERGDLELLPPRARRAAQARLALELLGGKPSGQEFACDLLRGAAVERVWLRGVGAEQEEYYTTLQGELLADSQLWPHLTAGTKVKLVMGELKAVRE
jgi:hypothetical protein